MRKTLLIALLALGGCSSIKPITMPDGRAGFLVVCERNFQSIADCRNDARKACNGGNYEEVTRRETYLEIVCVA